MEIRQFEAFLAVAEELHFGRAAERLHLAQPALSRMIRSLEKDLGAELFERTTRKVHLTSAGEALLDPAKAIAIQIRGVRRIARSAKQGEIGNVKIGFAGTTGYAIVSELSREVSIRKPGINVQLQPRSFAGEALGLLRDGELDLAVVSPPAVPGIEMHLVRNETFLLALPDHHRLTHRKRVAMEELRSERFVSYPATQGSRVRDSMVALCANAGFVPDIVQEAPDAYSLLVLVGAGVGIGVVVSASLGVRVAGVTYVEVTDKQPPLPIALGWRASNPSFALRRVVEIAREIFPEVSLE